MRGTKKFLGVGMFLILCSSVWAAVPKLMNYQALLTDDNDNPVRNQTLSIKFTIYDAAVNGASKWTETQGSVMTNNDGFYNVLLGSVTPILDSVFRDTARWLGIKVDTDAEMTPRVRLTSTGYAYRVNSIDDAAGGDIYGDLSLHSTLKVGDLSGDVGKVEITNGSANRITADGATGVLKLNQQDGTAGAELSGGTTTPDDGASLLLRESDNAQTIIMNAEGTDGGAEIRLANGAAVNTNTIILDAQVLTTGPRIVLKESAGDTSVVLQAAESGDLGADLSLRNSDGDETIELDADQSNGAFFGMAYGTTRTVHLDANGVSGGAQFSLMDVEGFTTISLDAESGTDGGANLVLTDGSTNTSTANRIILDANSGAAGGALITLKDATGTDQIFLDANWASSGRSRIVVDEVQINGADLSEQFDVKAVSGSIESGMVVCIDPEHSGELLISNQAYDRKVAGIISGAGGIYPGMLMGQSGSMADGKYPIALTGRVYCWVDASNESIQPGDLLTTSDILGHAMKVTDFKKAQGAIIGKAMTGLEKGRGLVLVLVNLQ